VAVETVSWEQAGEILGCKRSRVFELLASGDLERAPRIGKEIRIFRASVDRVLLNGLGGDAPKRKRRTALPESCDLDDFRHLVS
jgi:hypothetical protein